MTFAQDSELEDAIEAQLPSRERASALVEAFQQNMTWFYRPVSRKQMLEELVPKAYGHAGATRVRGRRKGNGKRKVGRVSAQGEFDEQDDHEDGELEQRMDLHDLALLLCVFAVGAVFDLTLPPLNPEAERYRHLARAALGLKSVFDSTSFTAVQAVILLANYDLISGRKDSLETAWKIMGLGLTLGMSVSIVLLRL